MNSKYREQTCCFVGHKDIPPGEQLKILARVEHRLIPLIQQGVTYFGIGGSLGFDTLMADMLVSLKAAHPRIRIIEVLPFEGYRSKWSLEQQRHAEKIDKQVDKVVYIAKEPSRGVYLQRNRNLVDCSAYCISYCTRTTGGTAYTVKYALEHGVTVYNASSFDVSFLLQAQPLGKDEQEVSSHKMWGLIFVYLENFLLHAGSSIIEGLAKTFPSTAWSYITKKLKGIKKWQILT